MVSENKLLSDRQLFRAGVLENVSIAMMFAPFVAISCAGRFHMLSLFLGIVLMIFYGLYLYYISKRVYGSYEEVLINWHGKIGRLEGIVYYFRFTLRAALFLILLGEIITEYMLVNINKWIIIISFFLVCLYASGKSIIGRARLLEMLFLWMVIPLILMAVFSVNSVSVLGNIDFKIPALSQLFPDEALGILAGGYGFLILVQSMELMLFTADHAKNNTKINALKIVIWIGISVFVAYVFIVGILGGRWVTSDSKAAFNVMEAASFPGEAINRLDYLVLAFLMIGIFATVSGYLFCARRILVCEFDNKKEGLIKTIIPITVAIMMVLLSSPFSRGGMIAYLIYGDFALSLILPIIVLRPRKVKR